MYTSEGGDEGGQGPRFKWYAHTFRAGVFRHNIFAHNIIIISKYPRLSITLLE